MGHDIFVNFYRLENKEVMFIYTEKTFLCKFLKALSGRQGSFCHFKWKPSQEQHKMFPASYAHFDAISSGLGSVDFVTG
jgi:hypothetical protein